ncbi:hypothetical protein GCM10023115_26240 [Pontixanthobacter gangjinensis]
MLSNCFVIYEYGQDASRWGRLITTGIFLFLLICQKVYSKRILSAFVLLLLSDTLLFSYEDSLANTATFLLRISAYLMLVFTVLPELKNLKSSLFQKLIFFVVFVLNLGMLFMLVDMVPPKFGYPYLNVLFYAYGISMITMLIAAISYSNRYSNKTSFYYTAASLCLVFSDITSFIAYYLEFYEFYFPDRIFYILGIAGMVKFATFARSHEAVAELESL